LEFSAPVDPLATGGLEPHHYQVASFRTHGVRATSTAFAMGLTLTACKSDPADIETLPGVNITVTPSQLTLRIGASASLAATVTDLEGRPLTGRQIQWSSSKPNVVAVSPAGVVTALDVGTAAIGAYSEQGVGFAHVVVHLDFRVPLRRWVLLTEMGTPTPACPGNEGGLRSDDSRDCTHRGVSRYSLDFAPDPQQEDVPGEPPPTEVSAAADGTITDVCRQPPTEITCGPNGPFVQVEHRGGFMSIYAHLDPGSITLRRKTPVSRGQRLGAAGAWGADSAPWLHFEVRQENQGAGAAAVLEAVEVGGRKFRDYKVASTSVRALPPVVSAHARPHHRHRHRRGQDLGRLRTGTGAARDGQTGRGH
jgi:hypothetical protein